MRISDWSSDVCSSDLCRYRAGVSEVAGPRPLPRRGHRGVRGEESAQQHIVACGCRRCGMSQRHLPPQHQDVLSIPATDLAAFDARSLFQLKTLAADRLATARAQVDHIEHALNLKYAERAKHLRLVAAKDSGVVHFDDGDVRITADPPKKVDWDQELLANLDARIAANGDNPREFNDLSYRVSTNKLPHLPLPPR